MSFEAKSLTEGSSKIRSKWGWFLVLGILLLILGGVAFGNLFIATIASVYFIGWMMLISGVVGVIHAFGVKSWGRFFWWLVSGLLYAAAGIFTFYNPTLASIVFTFLLAAALVGSGALRAWVGYQSWDENGSGWIVTAGLVTILAGVVIALGWPVNSLRILGLFLAIDLIFQGWALIAFSLALRK